MRDNVRDMPFSELMPYVLETDTAPTHIGCIQIFKPRGGSSTKAARTVYEDFLASDVGTPFNAIPIFPRFRRPQWLVCEDIDLNRHVQYLTLESPGSIRQLLDLVGELHEGKMDRDVPGWENYIIDGIADNRFAIYHKYHHAYMDGGTFAKRFDRLTSKKPTRTKAVPLWAPCPPPEADTAARKKGKSKPVAALVLGALKDANGLFLETALQAARMRRSEAPLPFSAPRSIVNEVKHAARAIGEGALELTRVKEVARWQDVSVNEVVLTLVGAGLESYLGSTGESRTRDLIAGCPMTVRREGDAEGGNMIAALLVKLGKPGSDIVSRLGQVHASSRDAKASFRSVGREGLMLFQTAVMGTAALLAISPIHKHILPISNVNVSNVAVPPGTYFLRAAELVRTIPASALSGSAINITFSSVGNLMEYGIISDAVFIPNPSRLAADIATAFEELYAAVSPAKKGARRKTRAK